MEMALACGGRDDPRMPAERAPVPRADDDRHHHDVVDRHGQASWLEPVVLGGQDGLVNVLGVLLGVAAATSQVRIVLAAGLAAAVAESVSMAAVAYTSKAAANDQYESERAREHRHIDAVPDLERDEVRSIFLRKGFSGELLERIVATVTSDRETWVALMLSEEHKLAPITRRENLRTSAIVGAAALIGSILPLLPFVVLGVGAGIAASLVLSAVTLFAFGVYKARITVGAPLRSGVELAVIGLVSALAGYAIGWLFQAPTLG